MKRTKISNASDLGINLNQIPARAIKSVDWVYLAGCEPWSMVDHALAFLGQAACPVCKGERLKKTRYCLGCDRTGLDGGVEFAGLDVGSAMNPDYPDETEKHGEGEPKTVKFRKGVARSRRVG